MYVEPVWLIECWRCSYSQDWAETATDAGPKAAAMQQFRASGWAPTEGDYQLCPKCRGIQ